MPERRDAVTLTIDMDTGRVAAGAAEIEAYLAAIRDETVNIDIDVDAEDLRQLSKTMRATSGDLVRLDRYLKKNNATLDRRTKLFRSLHPLTQDFINDNWDALKATEANEDGVRDLSAAIKDSRNAHAALASTVQDATERQRQYSRGVEKAQKVERDRQQQLEALRKELEAQDKAYRKNLAMQEKARRENDKFDLSLAQIEDRFVKAKLAAERMGTARFAFATPKQQAAIRRAAAEAEYLAREYERLGGDSDRLRRSVDDNSQALGDLISTLSRVRLHLGFFSLNVKQALYALVAFGPIITGIIGAFSALVGVIGVGLVGAMGLAGAAIGGFIFNAIGLGTALKPLINEFSTAVKAANDYRQQVIETGKNSEEAQDALEEYKTTLKGLPPETRKAVVQFEQMRARWSQVTEELRGPFFDLMADGLRTMTSLMPIFQRNTVKAFDAAAGGLQKWLAGLRTNEARTIINSMMSTFANATPAILSGIGSLATAFGRLSKASSRQIGQVMQTFSTWAQGLADSAGTLGFAQRVDDMIEKLRAVGRLLTATGRMLWTFFTTGADAGERFTNTMTATINRWTRWMKSVEGQQSLQKFFAQSVEEMVVLYSMLRPIVRIFIRFVEVMRPVSMTLQRITAAALELADALFQVPLVSNLVGIAVAMRVFKAIGSIFKTAATGLRVLGGAVLAAATAQRVKTAATAADTVATNANTAATGANAAAQRAQVAMFGAQAAASSRAATATGVATARTGAFALAGSRLIGFLGGPWGAAVTVAILGLSLFGDKLFGLGGRTETFEEQLHKLEKAQRSANTALSAGTNMATQAENSYIELEQAVKAYNKAIEAGKKPPQTLAELENLAKQTNDQQLNAVRAARQYSRQIQQIRNDTRDLALTQIDSLRRSLQKEGDAQIMPRAMPALNKVENQIKRGLIPNIAALKNSLRGVDLPEGFMTSMRRLVNIRLQRPIDEINALRMALRQAALPQATQGQLFSVISKLRGLKLPKGEIQAATDSLQRFMSTVGPKTASSVTNMLYSLQRLGPGGKRAAASLMQGLDPKRPKAAIRAIETEYKRLAERLGRPGKMPPIRLNLQNADRQLTQFLTRSRKTKDIRVMPNLKEITSRINKFLNQRRETKITIKPEWAGQWTKNATVFVKEEPRRAMGGSVTPEDKGTARPTRGGRFARPTFLVGEERRDEYVIATNPAYREANIGYLMDAAAALGIPMFKKGGKKKKGGGKEKKGGGKKKQDGERQEAEASAEYSTEHHLPGSLFQIAAPPFPKIGKKQAGGEINWLQNYIIPWSEAERERTRALSENMLARGGMSEPAYEEFLFDIDRSIDMYTALLGLSTKTISRAKKTLKKNKSKDGDSKKQKGKKAKKRENARETLQELRPEVFSNIPNTIAQLEAEKEQIKRESEGFGDGGQTIAQGQVALSAARYNLMQQFGSNVVGTGALGGMSFARAAGTPSLAGFTSSAGTVTAGSSVGSTTSVRGYNAGDGISASAGGKTVSITNNYQEPPPDPHTWSKQVEWEASVL